MYSTNLGTFDLLSKRGLRSSHEEVEYWIPYRNPVSCARKAAPEKLSFFAYDEQVRERLVSARIHRISQRGDFETVAYPGLTQADHGCRLQVDPTRRVYRFISDHHRVESSHCSTTARRFGISARRKLWLFFHEKRWLVLRQRKPWNKVCFRGILFSVTNFKQVVGLWIFMQFYIFRNKELEKYLFIKRICVYVKFL